MKIVNTALFQVYQFYFHCRAFPIFPPLCLFPLWNKKKSQYTQTQTKKLLQPFLLTGAKNGFTGIYKVSLTTPAIWLLKEALDMWLEPHYLSFHALVLPKLLLGTFKIQTVAQICLCKNWHIHDLFSRDLFLNIFLFKRKLLNFIILIFLFPHDSKEND